MRSRASCTALWYCGAGRILFLCDLGALVLNHGRLFGAQTIEIQFARILDNFLPDVRPTAGCGEQRVTRSPRPAGTYEGTSPGRRLSNCHCKSLKLFNTGEGGPRDRAENLTFPWRIRTFDRGQKPSNARAVNFGCKWKVGDSTKLCENSHSMLCVVMPVYRKTIVGMINAQRRPKSRRDLPVSVWAYLV